jgi:hypothetical protein
MSIPGGLSRILHERLVGEEAVDTGTFKPGAGKIGGL